MLVFRQPVLLLCVTLALAACILGAEESKLGISDADLQALEKVMADLQLDASDFDDEQNFDDVVNGLRAEDFNDEADSVNDVEQSLSQGHKTRGPLLKVSKALISWLRNAKELVVCLVKQLQARGALIKDKFLNRDSDPKAMFAELLGKLTGMLEGVKGSIHTAMDLAVGVGTCQKPLSIEASFTVDAFVTKMSGVVNEVGKTSPEAQCVATFIDYNLGLFGNIPKLFNGNLMNLLKKILFPVVGKIIVKMVNPFLDLLRAFAANFRRRSLNVSVNSGGVEANPECADSPLVEEFQPAFHKKLDDVVSMSVLRELNNTHITSALHAVVAAKQSGSQSQLDAAVRTAVTALQTEWKASPRFLAGVGVDALTVALDTMVKDTLGVVYILFFDLYLPIMDEVVWGLINVLLNEVCAVGDASFEWLCDGVVKVAQYVYKKIEFAMKYLGRPIATKLIRSAVKQSMGQVKAFVTQNPNTVLDLQTTSTAELFVGFEEHIEGFQYNFDDLQTDEAVTQTEDGADLAHEIVVQLPPQIARELTLLCREMVEHVMNHQIKAQLQAQEELNSAFVSLLADEFPELDHRREADVLLTR